jgi:eukaryotic-like serine/threonine-protein kinase
MPPDDDVEILIASLPAAFRERFEIVERIGSGGTGIVYKGLDKTLQRHFALKVLNPDQVTDERILRLHREAKTLCQLKHPNIVSILDFIITESGKPALLMELVEGRSLQEIIDENGPLPIEETVQILLQICQAMNYAHAHSVLHRDLSPNNILVKTNKDGSHEVKVVDFGISKVETIQDRTIVKSGSLVGSVTIISPEQARGQRTDQRSDIYSLGCLAFRHFRARFLIREAHC